MQTAFRLLLSGTMLALLMVPAMGRATIDALLVASAGSNLVAQRDELTGADKGTFASGMANPRGMALGPDGHVYVASYEGHVKRFDGDTGALIGVFLYSGINAAQGPTFGPDGNLYLSHILNGVRRYDGSTGAFIDIFATGVDPADIAFGPVPLRSLFAERLAGSTAARRGRVGFALGLADSACSRDPEAKGCRSGSGTSRGRRSPGR